jgi:hypothetical protein
MTVLTAQPPNNVVANVLRWTARLTSIASIGLLMQFLFGEPGTPTLSEAMLMAFFPFGVMAGMVLGWWKELYGGLFTVVSLAIFYMLMIVQRGQFPPGPYFILFALPGVMFLAAALARRAPTAA